MAKRKTKRNARRPETRGSFRVCKDPMVRLAEEEAPPNIYDRVSLTRVRGQSYLFAIPRDERTIFCNWDIDWPSVFKKVIPEDRQVHLQVIGKDGVIETRVGVEPMSAMHCLTVPGLRSSCRVEIGYFQPFDTWHSVATSAEVEMPRRGSVELADLDLATLPFHLSFQRLADLFRTPNDTPIARVVSEFQKRVLNSDKPNEEKKSERRILRNLNMSVAEIAGAEREFKTTDTEKLARRTREIFRFGGSSPTRRFQTGS